MIFKNSVKILFSNFDIVWRTLLYFFVVLLLSTIGMYLCINPVYKLLVTSGVIESIREMYTSFVTSLNLTELFLDFRDIVSLFKSVIVENISTIWINFAFAIFISFVFKTILCNMVIMANSNSLNYYMGSMNKVSYYSEFFSIFWKNLRAQLAYFIVSLPFKVLIAIVCYFELRLIGINVALSIFAPFLIVLTFVLLVSFKYSLLASWIPTMIIMNRGVFRSLGISIKLCFRKFWKIFANAIGIVLMIYFFNVFLGLFTFFVGLLVTIPASYLLYSVFGMVVVYDCQGMRYYVDVYNVVSPEKKERTDKISHMRYIV